MSDLTRKHCLKCAHLSCAWEGPAYSDVTPGDPAELSCRKAHWGFNSDTNDAFNARDKRVLFEHMESASDCPDYLEEKP